MKCASILPVPLLCLFSMFLWMLVGCDRSSRQPDDERPTSSPFGLSKPGPSTTPSLTEHRTSVRRPAHRELSSSTSRIAAAGNRLNSSLTDPKSRILQQLVTGWPADQIQGDLDLLFSKTSPTHDEMMLRSALLRHWAGQSPNHAAGWSESLPNGAPRISACEQIALAWLEQEPDAALDWARSLNPPELREQTLLTSAYELSSSDPPLAFEQAIALSASTQRDQLLTHTLGLWATTDAGAAVDAAALLHPTALRLDAIARIATSWAESSPVQAAQLTSSMPPGAAQDRAVAAVVQRWTQQNPDAAQEWVDSCPDSPTKLNALDHIAKIRASSPRFTPSPTP